MRFIMKLTTSLKIRIEAKNIVCIRIHSISMAKTICGIQHKNK